MKVLTMQDLSCYGESSLGIAWPLLSAFGLETAVLPSALLSTQTTGFDHYCSFPLTEQIKKIVEVWKSLNLKFDVCYTGYIADPAQFDLVLQIKEELLNSNGTLIVDPAMADEGKLYPGLDARWIKGMEKICKEAEVILPNFTEFCLLCDRDPEEVTSITELIGMSYDFCEESEISYLIITSVPGVDEDRIGTDSKSNLICFYDAYSCTGRLLYYENSAHLDGCGDLFSTFFTAIYCLTEPGDPRIPGYEVRMMKAIKLAHNAVTQIMENTLAKGQDLYGPKFQQALIDSIDLATLFGQEEAPEPEPKEPGKSKNTPDWAAMMDTFASFMGYLNFMDDAFFDEDENGQEEEDSEYDEDEIIEEDELEEED